MERRPGLDLYAEGDRPYCPLIVEELARMTDPSGALGDPGKATADKGRCYHEALVQSLADLIDEMRNRHVVLRRPTVLI